MCINGDSQSELDESITGGAGSMAGQIALRMGEDKIKSLLDGQLFTLQASSSFSPLQICPPPQLLFVNEFGLDMECMRCVVPLSHLFLLSILSFVLLSQLLSLPMLPLLRVQSEQPAVYSSGEEGGTDHPPQ